MPAQSHAVGKVVAPGDVVCQLPENGEVRIGGGLQLSSSQLCAVRSGILRQTTSGKLWVEGRQKRYIPVEDDLVIGSVVERHSENLIVDIGGPFHAVLPLLSFENATKRNKPAVFPGDIVYARVVAASRDMDPVLSCVDSAGHAAGYGPLKDGLIFTVNTAQARQLLAKPTAPILAALGRVFQYEAAVGMNGRVWVLADAADHTILVANAIQKAEFLTEVQCEALVRALQEA